MDTEVLIADLCTKVPCLQGILRPEYTPYLNTAATVLLGWIVVCWVSHLVWVLFAPLAVSAVAVTLVCPTTARWFLGQMGTNVESASAGFIERLQAAIPDIRGLKRTGV